MSGLREDAWAVFSPPYLFSRSKLQLRERERRCRLKTIQALSCTQYPDSANSVTEPASLSSRPPPELGSEGMYLGEFLSASRSLRLSGTYSLGNLSRKEAQIRWVLANYTFHNRSLDPSLFHSQLSWSPGPVTQTLRTSTYSIHSASLASTELSDWMYKNVQFAKLIRLRHVSEICQRPETAVEIDLFLPPVLLASYTGSHEQNWPIISRFRMNMYFVLLISLQYKKNGVQRGSLHWSHVIPKFTLWSSAPAIVWKKKRMLDRPGSGPRKIIVVIRRLKWSYLLMRTIIENYLNSFNFVFWPSSHSHQLRIKSLVILRKSHKTLREIFHFKCFLLKKKINKRWDWRDQKNCKIVCALNQS